MEKNFKRYQIYIQEELKKFFDSEAKLRKMSTAKLIRIVLDEYMKTYKRRTMKAKNVEKWDLET